MLSYRVRVHWRDATGISRPVRSWYAEFDGLTWLHELVSTGQASREGDGYPFFFRVRARDAIPVLRTEALGKMNWPDTGVPGAILNQLPADDWLDVEAWDQS